MTRFIKKTLISILTICISFSVLGFKTTYAKKVRQVNKTADRYIRISDYLTSDDLIFIKGMEKIYKYFSFDRNGRLVLTKDLKELKQSYDLSDEFILRLSNLLNFNLPKYNIENPKNKLIKIGNLKTPKLHVSDWKIYLTNDEVKLTLLSAAQAGPAAMTAALTALGSAYPGVGNIIGMIIGLVGGATIAYNVLQAVANNQGLYIGINWNGIFPNPVVGTW